MIPASDRRVPPRVVSVIRQCAGDHGCSVNHALSRSRSSCAVRTRRDAYRVLLNMGFCYTQVGHWFGRSHATVINAVRGRRSGSQGRLHLEHVEAMVPVPDLSGEWAI